jgi:hypothetical protein
LKEGNEIFDGFETKQIKKFVEQPKSFRLVRQISYSCLHNEKKSKKYMLTKICKNKQIDIQ